MYKFRIASGEIVDEGPPILKKQWIRLMNWFL